MAIMILAEKMPIIIVQICWKRSFPESVNPDIRRHRHPIGEVVLLLGNAALLLAGAGFPNFKESFCNAINRSWINHGIASQPGDLWSNNDGNALRYGICRNQIE